MNKLTHHNRRAAIISIVVFAIVSLYGIVRYNIFKGVAWEHLPLFIANKAISVSAVVLIGFSYLFGSLERIFPGKFRHTLEMRKFFGLAGFGLGAVHGIISLVIFNPTYYEKFFGIDGKLNLVGELSMLFGVLSLAVFSIVAISSLPGFFEYLGEVRWRRVQRLGYWGLVLVGAHVFSMGIAGWLTPSHWPGGLLPMSLVAFIVIAAVFLVKLIALMRLSGK